MKEISGDIWDFHKDGHYICIPTNGIVTNDGYAVMGKGLALQCSNKFGDIKFELGKRLRIFQNTPQIFKKYKIITFPTKNDWQDDADTELIKKSARLLLQILETYKITKVYLPRVGCGLGRLIWTNVRKVLREIFKDHTGIFIVNYIKYK